MQHITKKPNIIIVDDNNIFLKGIKLIMTIENIANVIGVASNGQEFLELLSTTKPDLVFMDIEMPVMNGLDATEKAIEINPDIKIIAFTMFGEDYYFIKMLELGVKGYIMKSADITEIENAIKIVMGGEKYFSHN